MRPRTSLPAAILVVAAAVASTPPAFGETTAANKAAADALYEAGQRLIKDHKYEEALAKLLASQKLDPGLGTLLNAAYCYDRIGKIASAWALYNEVAALAKSSDDKQGRGEIAAEAAKALEPRLSKVVVTVPNESRVASLEVRRDGEVVDPATWGTPIPVDPGTHNFEASAPGRAPWKAAVEIPAGPGTMPVAVPVLALGPAPAEAGPPPGPWWGTQRIAGVVMASGGGLAAVAGAVLGGVTLAKVSSLKNSGHCNANLTACDETGLSLRQDAKNVANGSTGALVAGGVLFATGVAVFATGSSGSAPAPARSGSRFVVGPIAGTGMTGVLVKGEW
jgi:hypothetical protein